MKTKITVLALIVSVVGVFAFSTRTRNVMPSDFRDAPGAPGDMRDAGAGSSIDTLKNAAPNAVDTKTETPNPAAIHNRIMRPVVSQDMSVMIAKLRKPSLSDNHIFASLNKRGQSANFCLGKYAPDMILITSSKAYGRYAQSLARYDFIDDILVTKKFSGPKLKTLGNGTSDFVVAQLGWFPQPDTMAYYSSDAKDIETKLSIAGLDAIFYYHPAAENSKYYIAVAVDDKSFPSAMRILQGIEHIVEIQLNQRLYDVFKSQQQDK